MNTSLLSVNNVSRSFDLGAGLFKPKRILRAVDDVSLEVKQGEVLGIVGESGCGKSTLAKMLLGLLAPTHGEVRYQGQDVRKMDRKQFAREVQPVFQDPYSSLNPRKTLLELVTLPLKVHDLGSADEQRRSALEMLDRVGLPARFKDRRPGELSGGQRQRVAIARALIMKPKVLVCDEPTSALDVSVQSHILNLLGDLRRDFGLTYVFISHNLAVVEHIASRVAVMYLGKVVELAPSERLFSAPQHPYTKALLASVLTPQPGLGIPDAGLGMAFPDPMNPPSGCRFHPRCNVCMPQCSSVAPVLKAHGSTMVSCLAVERQTSMTEIQTEESV